MDLPKPYVIVVGVDYSDLSRLALREALRIAAARGPSQVHALHVEAIATWFPAAQLPGHFPADKILSEAFPRLERLLNEELAAVQGQQQTAGTPSSLRALAHIRTESPAREIAQMASDLEADLVVVGTHGRTALTRLMVGSVAHGVVSLSPCPVLVVRPKRLLLAGPAIDPPCPNCLEARQQSGGRELWCSQHREHHGQRRHTYFQEDRSSTETNFPLVFEE